MLSAELQNKLNKFNEKYSVNFNLENMGVEEERFAELDDDFMFERVDENVAKREIYNGALRNLLLESLNTKTRIAKNNNYNLERFNFARFIKEFEELVAQRNAESENPKERKPYENMRFNEILDAVKHIARPYNQSICGLWATKILNNKDKLTYKDLKAVTDGAIRLIDARGNGPSTYSHNDLVNVVYAKAAMERVRQSRTGWWKFWHLYDNYQEYKYLRDLTNKVNEYNSTILSVGEIERSIPGEILENAYNDFDVEDVEQMQGILSQAAEQNRIPSNVAETMEKVIAEPTTIDSITEDIIKALPKGGFPDQLKRMFLKNNILPMMFAKMKECNRSFDTVVSERILTQEKEMPSMVEKMFEKAFPTPSTLGYVNDEKQQLLVSQIIVDALLKKVSPVALNPALAQFANGYVLNNANEYSGITGFYAHDDVMIQAKEAYNAMNVERVNISEVSGDNAPIVQPVEKKPVAQSLGLGNNK